MHLLNEIGPHLTGLDHPRIMIEEDRHPGLAKPWTSG